MIYFAEATSVVAITVSVASLWYACRSARAAEDSAEVARQALAFERESRAAERSDRREQRLSELLKETLEAWGVHGSIIPILERETDLSPSEQEELARRVYRARGEPEEHGIHAIAQWKKVKLGR